VQNPCCPRNGKRLRKPDTSLTMHGVFTPHLKENTTVTRKSARWAHRFGNPNLMKAFPFAAVCGTALICLSVSPTVLAEETTTQLDEIVVTADRKARTVDETLTPVTIITRKDIEKYQATDVVEVLRRVPGLSISNDGGIGKSTSIRLRGTESRHVLVLLDGVKLGSATLGTVSFQHIPVAQIERIEVVRGSRSSLYGSEAIGGVIQLFTRKSKAGFQPELVLQAGTNDTNSVNLNFAGGDANTWYNMGIGAEQAGGINAHREDTTLERDGYERNHGTFRVGHRFANHVQVETSLTQTAGDSAYDNAFTPTTSNPTETAEQQTLASKLTAPINATTTVTAQLGQLDDTQDNYDNGTFSNGYKTRRTMGSLQVDSQILHLGNLTLGIDQQKDKIQASDLDVWSPGDQQYSKKTNKNSGIFANYQQDFGKTDMELSMRRDASQQFGKHNSGTIAVGHDLSDNLRLKASYGTAFKAPSMNDLYYPDTPFGIGNPDLKAESSRNREIGVQGKWQHGTWEANAFHNRVDNLITWQPVDPANTWGQWTPTNVGKVDIKGVEASISTQIHGFDISGNATLQQANNISGENAGKRLINRPHHLASVDIDRKLGKFNVGATVQGEGKRYSDATNAATTKLPGYATVDLRADYQLSKDWAVGAKIRNVLDKDYQTNYGYNQDGINGLVTVKYAPK